MVLRPYESRNSSHHIAGGGRHAAEGTRATPSNQTWTISTFSQKLRLYQAEEIIILKQGSIVEFWWLVAGRHTAEGTRASAANSERPLTLTLTPTPTPTLALALTHAGGGGCLGGRAAAS